MHTHQGTGFHSMVDCPICQQLEKGDDMSWRHIFEKVGTCNHDLEEVWSTLHPCRELQPYLPEGWEVKNVFESPSKLTDEYWDMYVDGERVLMLGSTDVNNDYHFVYRKVCVKCGECFDGMKDYADKVVSRILIEREEEKKYQQRKDLAKSMWNECEKRGEV